VNTEDNVLHALIGVIGLLAAYAASEHEGVATTPASTAAR
jgi:hypothetical protein